MTQNLRQVHALILQATPVTARLRQVHALTLSNPNVSYGITSGQKASDALKAAIMAVASTTGKSLLATDFTLDNPVAITGTKNTSVKATASNIQVVSGSQTFRYDRKSLSGLAGLLPDGVSTVGVSSVHGLLSRINTITGFVLETRDFVDDPIDPHSPTVTLTAATTSYVFLPGTTVTVGSGLPNLSTVAPTKNLSGFDAA